MANKKSLKIDTRKDNYNRFLVFVNYYSEVKGTKEVSLRNDYIAKVLGVEKDTVKGYVSRARIAGILVNPSQVVYKASQKNPSNEYDIDLVALTKYLDTQKVEMDPFTGGEMLDKYFEVVGDNLEEKKRKRTRNKTKAANNYLQKSVHYVGMGDCKKWNSILDYKNKSDFKDSFLLVDKDNRTLRAVNVLCNTWNPDNEHKTDDEERLHKRENLLKEFGIENPVEYDVNGSIYRLSYNINHKESLPQDVDIYELFWDEMRLGIKFTKEIRVHFKKLCMPIFMKPQSIDSSVGDYWHTKNRINKGIKVKYNPKNQEQFEAYEFFYKLIPNLKKFLYGLRDAMLRVLEIDNFYHREIFLYESELILKIKIMFFERYGILLLNAYDGFYGDANNPDWNEENFFEIYEEATQTIKSRIMNPVDFIAQFEDPTEDDKEFMDDLKKFSALVVLPATITPIAKKVNYEEPKSWDDVLALEKEGKVMYF